MTACRICRGTRIHKMDCPNRPVERRATVAAPAGFEEYKDQLTGDPRIRRSRATVGGGESHCDFGISMTAQEMLSERADMVRDLREKNIRLERLLGELEKLIHFTGDEFARIATDANDNGGTDWWFECHKCGELIEGTVDLTDEKANGYVFRCSCGQEFIGSTHVMLHATEAARVATGGGK